MRNSIQGNIPEEIVLIQSEKQTISRQLEQNKEENIDVIPVFVSDANNPKTIATGVSWANRYVPYNANPKPIPIQEKRKNIPISGYRVFTLETHSDSGRSYKIISPDNKYLNLQEDILLDVILHTGINKNGILNGEFIFAKVGSRMKLIRYGSKLHMAIEKNMIRASNKILDTQLKVGHLYEDLRGHRSIFLGWVNSVNIDIKTRYNYSNNRHPTTEIIHKKCTIKNKTQLWAKYWSYNDDFKTGADPFATTNCSFFEFKKNQSMVEDLYDFSKFADLVKIKKLINNNMNTELASSSYKDLILSKYAQILSAVPINETVKLPQIFSSIWDGPTIEWEL